MLRGKVLFQEVTISHNHLHIYLGVIINNYNIKCDRRIPIDKQGKIL